MPQCAKKLDSCPKWIMWMLSNLKGCVIFHVVFNSDSRGMSWVRLCMSVLPIHDWSVGSAQLQLGHCDQSSLDELPAKTDSYAENCMSIDVGLHRAQLSKHQLIKKWWPADMEYSHLESTHDMDPENPILGQTLVGGFDLFRTCTLELSN